MEELIKTLSYFLDIVILKIDNEGKILDTVVNTHEDLKISKLKNIFSLFSKEEKFRLQRVLESGIDVRKKYMQLDKKSTGLNEYVDLQLYEYEEERYIFIQFFESNREREVLYDRHLEKLTNLSERDPLTKVFNRQGFEEKIRRLIKTSDPKKRLGVIYVDIDKLKTINDTYGHKMGDRTILNVIEKLISSIRERDIVARLGGDEFVIVVEEITGSNSTTYGLAKRLLRSVANDNKKKYSTTLSMGVHILEVEEVQKYIGKEEKFAQEWNKHLNKADDAAYESKENGRNQISVSKEFSNHYKL